MICGQPVKKAHEALGFFVVFFVIAKSVINFWHIDNTKYASIYEDIYYFYEMLWFILWTTIDIKSSICYYQPVRWKNKKYFQSYTLKFGGAHFCEIRRYLSLLSRCHLRQTAIYKQTFAYWSFGFKNTCFPWEGEGRESLTVVRIPDASASCHAPARAILLCVSYFMIRA